MGFPARVSRRPDGRRDLRLYLAGQATSVFGSTLTTTASSVVAVVVLHAGPRQISLIVISGTVPMLLLGPWAGVLADRVLRPRRALLAADAVAGLVVLGCGLAGLAHLLAIAWLCGLSFTLSLCGAFVESVYFAHLRGLGVADLGRARGQLQSSEMLSRSAAASVAGALVELLGAAFLFIGDALSYLVSVMCLRALRAPDRRVNAIAPRNSVRHELAEGLAVVRGHRLLTAYLGYSFLVGVAVTGVAAQRPVFLLKVLALPVALYSLPAVGATLLGAAGSMLAPRLLDRAGDVRTVLTVAAVAAPVSALALPAAGGPTGLVLVAVSAGTALPLFFGATSNLALITLLSRDIGEAFFGRIVGLMTSCATLASTVGAVAGGYLGGCLGVRTGILLCQGCGIAGALVLLAGARTAGATTPEGSPVMERSPSAPVSYPPALRGEDADDYHGQRVADPYRWLEDRNDPATRDWQRAQQELAADYLDTIPGIAGFGATLERLAVGPGKSPVKIAGIREFRVARPSPDSGWVTEVREAPSGEWRPLLAASALGRDAVVRRWRPSPQGRYLALQVMEAGDESATPLTVVDVATGEIVQTCGLTRYSPVEWRADERSFCYVRRHLDRPGSGVYLHEVGTDLAADRLLLGDDSPTTRYHVNLWHDRWLLISVRDGTSRESRLLIGDLNAGQELRPLPCEGAGAGGVLVDSAGRLLATVAGADDCGQVMRAEPGPDDGWLPWQTLIPQADDAILAGVTLTSTELGDRLVVLRSRIACSELTIHDAATGALVTEVTVPGQGTITGIGPTYDPAQLSVTYTDWTTPLSEWVLDVTSGVMLPAGEPPASYGDVQVMRTTYQSGDGTIVPLTILAPSADAAPVSTRQARPTILTGYGGFGIPVRPTYQPDALAWVAHGGVVAVAGVRGGGEYGKAWHEAAVGTRKVNAFADLHAAGDWLIAHGWTAAGMLALLGGSNGGLLITAEMVAHPDRYAALSSFAAPLDMIRYQMSGLGRAWRREYGSPDNEQEFTMLLRYSPYHNAGLGRYPAVLLTIGTNDTRVDPSHSRKMAAQLQYASTSGGPILLQVIEGAGHLGVSGERANQLASRMLAFLAAHTGLPVEERQD